MNEHITPIPVVVVTPRHSGWSEFGILLGKTIGVFGMTFLVAWFLTMLLPIVFEVTWDYWRCFWLLLLLRFIIPRPHSFQYQSNRRSAQPNK
jgi:hypothetical protein